MRSLVRLPVLRIEVVQRERGRLPDKAPDRRGNERLSIEAEEAPIIGSLDARCSAGDMLPAPRRPWQSCAPEHEVYGMIVLVQIGDR
jgi:hypothetical protein